MKAAIIGSGAMGAGIAQVLAQAGHNIQLLDANPAALERASQNLGATLRKLEAKGTLASGKADLILSRIKTTSSYTDLADTDLVIEAVVEDLEVKRQLFSSIENYVKPHCVVATNTSSLSVTSIASALKHPERCIGIHFFNPAPLMQLVEVVPALQTDPALPGIIATQVRQWGKHPVIAQDTPGFIVNRLARPYYGEAIRILEEGIADVATIDWAMTQHAGFRMGPFELMDLIGHDVNYRVTESVWASFYYDPRYRPSLTQKRLMEAGFYGRKTGRGFYNYAEGVQKPQPKQNEALARQITQRILAMLVNEAYDALYLKLATADDLDMAMTRGVNYPKGLLLWGRELGLKKVVSQLDELHQYYGDDRYRVSPGLRQAIV